MAFGSGSKVIMPLKNEAGMPLNGFEVAQNVAEVLAYNPDIRYIGMSVFCIDEKMKYIFKTGIEDSDFVPENSSGEGLIIVQDYTEMPSSTNEKIVYCKNSYEDTGVSPSVTYSNGFYLYDTTKSKWVYIGETSVELSKTETPSEQTTITTESGASYDITVEKTEEKIGQETTIVLRALENKTLDDGTEIYAGDIISINKYIGDIETYSHNVIGDNIYNPFE